MSKGARFLGLALAVFLAVSGAALPAAAADSADTTPPVLTYVELMTPTTVGPGQYPRIKWIATDDNRVGSIIFWVRCPDGKYKLFSTSGSSTVGRESFGETWGSGMVSKNAGWPAGEYVVESAWFSDSAGNVANTADDASTLGPGVNLESLNFTVEYPLEEVTPSAVTFPNNTYTVPVTNGVDYFVGGDIIPPGTYSAWSTVTVTARAQDGYVLAPGATSSWTTIFPSPVPGSSMRLNDFTNDKKTDVIARDASGQLWLYPGTGAGDWFKRIDLGSGWNVMTSIVSAGDFNGDDKADVIARDTAGELWFYPGTGNGDWSTRQNMGGGWNVMTSIVAPGDFDADGRPDLIARDSSGELWLYRSNGEGDWHKRVDLGGGWNTMNSIVAPGDFNSDGRVDLVARDTNGRLWVYPGNGSNEWFKRVDLGAGWNTMNAITAPGDMNDDGRPDIIARDTTGELWLYPNNGKGDWFKRIDLGPGWNPMTAIL